MYWKIMKESHYTPFADKVTIPFFKAYQLAYAERRERSESVRPLADFP